MGNDASSARFTEKIMQCSERGEDLSKLTEVISEISPRHNADDIPFILWVVKKTSIFFIILILPLYYFLSLFAFIPFYLIGLTRGERFRQLIDLESLEILFNHWGKYPNSFLTKAFELLYFSQEAFDQPSLEIGVYKGHTSRAVFHKKHITVGMEFVPLHLLNYAMGDNSIHMQLMGADIYHIPFIDHTFKSILSVHSMDDIQRGAQEAISEMSRVLKPGGKLFFSSYSEHFGRHNILLRIFLLFGLKRLHRKAFELIYAGSHNIHCEQTWRDMLNDHGLVVEKYVHFVPMKIAWLIDIPFRLEGYLMNLFDFHNALKPVTYLKKLRKFYFNSLIKILCGIWSISFDNNGKDKPGMNIFVVAKKVCDKHEIVNDYKLDDHPIYRFLQCPACKYKLADDTGKVFIDSTLIICRNCKSRYPIIAKNIPLLIINNGYRSL
jgi:uncharacterized protein YbaR (Trm112 family)